MIVVGSLDALKTDETCSQHDEWPTTSHDSTGPDRRPRGREFDDIRKRGCLRAIVNSYTPGLAFREQPGEPIKGFEIELIHELAAGVFGHTEHNAVELIEAPNEVKLDMLREGEVDMVVANLTITSERWKSIDFCGSYHSVQYAPLLGKGVPDAKSTAEANEYRIGFEATASTFEHVNRYLPRAELIPMEGPDEWLTALATGKIDAMWGDSVYNAGIVRRSTDGLSEGTLRCGVSHAAVGVTKENQALRRYVDDTVAEMLSSGRLASRLRHWRLG